VTVVDEAAPLGNSKIVEMSGPASEESPYSVLHHLAIVPHTDPNLERHTAQNALRLASVKTSVYLAKTSLGQSPDATEVFQSDGPTQAGRDGLPRVAYIGQIHSRQRVAEVDEQILYGANTAGMVPVMLHPNEWLDGGVVSGYQNMGVETYFYQNHPVISELYRWHREGKITLVGTIATMAASDNSDRERNCMLASEMAKWNLAADGVVLTKYGGGAPHADMALTARLCEQSGIFTTVQVSDMSRDRQAESALLFNYPEVDAIVYVGGGDTNWDLPAVEKVVAGNPAMTAALEVAQEIPAGGICGVTSQQGISKLRCFVY
jgi:glycine reductase